MSAATLLLIAGSLAASPSDPTGGFISFPSDWYKVVYNAAPAKKAACFSELWRREFVNLKAMKFDTVVIQFSLKDCSLFFDGKVTAGGSVLSPDTGDIIYKSVGAVLQEAKNQNMKVWIGLRHKEVWNNANWPKVVTEHEIIVKESLAVAQGLIESKLLAPETFAGWYISPEIDNYDKDFKETVRSGKAMLKAISDGLDPITRKAGLVPSGSGTSVAISAYFRPASGNMIESRYMDFLEQTLGGSGITHLLFQDSVGVEDSATKPKKNLDAAEKDTLRKRYDALIAVGQKVGLTIWADIEVFAGGKAEVGAPATRVLDQLEPARVCPKRLVYSTNVHLSEFATRGGCPDLFKALYQEFSGKTIVPAIPPECAAK